MIPEKPLLPLETYAVAVTWENDAGARLDQSFSFTTAGILSKLKLSRKLGKGRKAKLTAPAEATGQRATVKIAVARKGHKAKTVLTKKITLKRSQSIKTPKKPRGGSVTVSVSVAKFTLGDTQFTVTPAKQRY